MSAILKRRRLIAAQPQPGFMDEGRGLKCLSGDFVCHSPGRQTAKLFIDERQEFLGGFRVALFQPTQNMRDSRQGLRMRRKRRKSESRCGSVGVISDEKVGIEMNPWAGISASHRVFRGDP